MSRTSWWVGALAALVATVGPAGAGPGPRPVQVADPALSRADDAFLERVQRDTFRYFLDCVNRENGLVLDRAQNGGEPDFGASPATVAGSGFALACWVVGAERGWLPREEARQLTRTTLRYFRDGLPNEHGFYYHFVDARTGARMWSCELSSVDTSLFLVGALTARGYWADDPEVRQLVDALVGRVDWPWMTAGGTFLGMGWKPESGFLPDRWDRYCESLFMYLMALGSPTHPLAPAVWGALQRPRGKYGAHEFVLCPPLFTHQYSNLFVDFRDKDDGFVDYFRNSTEATLANRQFCMDAARSFAGLGPDCWGLTAALGPTGYRAYGAPPGIQILDGTVAPTAAGGSLAFTPELSLRALRYLHRTYGAKLYGRYGFTDSFNPSRDWYSPDAFAINQAPILLAAENLRTGLIWRSAMKSPVLAAGLARAGFRPSTGFTFDRERCPFTGSRAYFLHERPTCRAPAVPDGLSVADVSFESPLWRRPDVRPLVMGDEYLQSGVQGQKGYKARTWALHNGAWLFFRGRVWDRQVRSTHGPDELYLDDSVELYLDVAQDGLSWTGPDDYQVVASPDAATTTLRVREFLHRDRPAPPLPSLFRRRADGWEFVVAVPRARLGLTRQAVNFTVAYHNVDRAPGSDCKLNWFFAEPGIWLGTLELDP